MVAAGCTLLEQILSHEVGHAFGLGHAVETSALMHLYPGACGPTPYDTAATMAIYQSR